MTTLQARSLTFDPADLQRILDGRYAGLRAEIREVMSRPQFAPVLELGREEYRAQVMSWARELAAEGVTAPGFPVAYGGEGRLRGQRRGL